MALIPDIPQDSSLEQNISRITPPALRKRLAASKAADEPMLQVTNSFYSSDPVEGLLQSAEAALQSPTPISEPNSSPTQSQAAPGTAVDSENQKNVFGDLQDAAEIKAASNKAKRKCDFTHEDKLASAKKLRAGDPNLSKNVPAEKQNPYSNEEHYENDRQHMLKERKDAMRERYKLSEKLRRENRGKGASSKERNKRNEECADDDKVTDDSSSPQIESVVEIPDDQGKARPLAEEEEEAWKRTTDFYPERENKITEDMKEKLKEVGKKRPPYLYHVHSTCGKPHTRGSATSHQMQPAAAVDEKLLYNSIFDFQTLSELVFNFGCRILWYIRKADQFSSYTTSLLFALVHALGRHLRGETGISISFIDTRTATTVSGEPAEFYYVPELQRIVRCSSWLGWGDMQFSKLNSPWYTHEYVAHGTLKLDEKNAFRVVPFQELIDCGLYDFARGLHVESEEKEMKKLYHRCVQLRYRWYHPDPQNALSLDPSEESEDVSSTAAEVTNEPSGTPNTPPNLPKPFTLAHLDQAAKLARLFNKRVDDSDTEDTEEEVVNKAHLQILLDLIGLFNGQKNDALYSAYIDQYYSAPDVQDILFDGMTNIPANLPETMQTMDRIREACAVFGLPAPAGNAVTPVDINFDFHGVWQGRLRDIITKETKSSSRKTQASRDGQDADAVGQDAQAQDERARDDEARDEEVEIGIAENLWPTTPDAAADEYEAAELIMRQSPPASPQHGGRATSVAEQEPVGFY